MNILESLYRAYQADRQYIGEEGARSFLRESIEEYVQEQLADSYDSSTYPIAKSQMTRALLEEFWKNKKSFELQVN